MFGMVWDGTCMREPASAACVSIRANVANHERVYFAVALVLAFASLTLHVAKSRLAVAALWSLALVPFLTLFLPLA
jgi:hypothetical protein